MPHAYVATPLDSNFLISNAQTNEISAFVTSSYDLKFNIALIKFYK